MLRELSQSAICNRQPPTFNDFYDPYITCVLFCRSLRVELSSWAYPAININSCVQALTKDISTPADIAPSALETIVFYCFMGYISALTYYLLTPPIFCYETPILLSRTAADNSRTFSGMHVSSSSLYSKALNFFWLFKNFISTMISLQITHVIRELKCWQELL